MRTNSVRYVPLYKTMFTAPVHWVDRSRHLPAFIELLAATGARPNEVLALRWCDVDLLADPPTVTIAGTLIDHGKVAGRPLHRQDTRKGDAPPHTVVLPRFGVDALASLVAESGWMARCSPTVTAAGCH
jgi:integrase